jgi:hypothetical protein
MKKKTDKEKIKEVCDALDGTSEFDRILKKLWSEYKFNPKHLRISKEGAKLARKHFTHSNENRK